MCNHKYIIFHASHYQSYPVYLVFNGRLRNLNSVFVINFQSDEKKKINTYLSIFFIVVMTNFSYCAKQLRAHNITILIKEIVLKFPECLTQIL